MLRSLAGREIKKMNTLQEKQQNRVRDVLLKYLLPDALKPQYDGMMAYELAGIILRESEGVEHEEMAKDFEERVGEGDL